MCVDQCWEVRIPIPGISWNSSVGSLEDLILKTSYRNSSYCTFNEEENFKMHCCKRFLVQVDTSKADEEA